MTNSEFPVGKWQFFVDRGGTFTDIIALAPDRNIRILKLLSDNPKKYEDAIVYGIRDVLGLQDDEILPVDTIDVVRLGSTVATNALLERKGAKTALVTTKGFADALRIGYQNRPDLFALNIVLPGVLYSRVIEVDERIGAQGEILLPLNIEQASKELERVKEDDFESIAVVFMHGYRYDTHERQVGELALKFGFQHISLSHEVSPLIKFVGRGDTTVADAYLSPAIKSYLDQTKKGLSGTSLQVMKSSGGLLDANDILGKDTILSGPAGGVVGAAKTCQKLGQRHTHTHRHTP